MVLHCDAILITLSIWQHLHNLKKLEKHLQGGVLLACNFTKSNTPPGAIFMFFKLYKWYQIAQSITKNANETAPSLSFLLLFEEMDIEKGSRCFENHFIQNTVFSKLSDAPRKKIY